MATIPRQTKSWYQRLSVRARTIYTILPEWWIPEHRLLSVLFRHYHIAPNNAVRTLMILRRDGIARYSAATSRRGPLWKCQRVLIVK